MIGQIDELMNDMRQRMYNNLKVKTILRYLSRGSTKKRGLLIGLKSDKGTGTI